MSRTPRTENPAGQPQTPRWRASFDGGSWEKAEAGGDGTEWPLQREFVWADRQWCIPSVYLCRKGLVVDLCMRVEPSEVEAFLEKWPLLGEEETNRLFSREEQMQLERDHPFEVSFRAVLEVNGTECRCTSRCSTVYHPKLGLPGQKPWEGKRMVEHYGLDERVGWKIWRISYPARVGMSREVTALSITMLSNAVPIPDPQFQVTGPGDTLSFAYGGQTYRLTVGEYDVKRRNRGCMRTGGLEYPPYYVVMGYTITPELPKDMVTIMDTREGDQPRPLQNDSGYASTPSHAAAIGIIGGVDGPVALWWGEKTPGALQSACCSSLYFEPVPHVNWQIVFYETQYETLTVPLLGKDAPQLVNQRMKGIL